MKPDRTQIVREGKISCGKQPRVGLQLTDDSAVWLVVDTEKGKNCICGVTMVSKLNMQFKKAPGIVDVEFENEQFKRLVHFHKLLSADNLQMTMYPIASIGINEDKSIGVLTHTDLPLVLLWDNIKGYENFSQLIAEFVSARK